ncbi:hypothetical protein HBI04_140330 [Parastagonospora nodorum]|nr:hypothetical protein HBH49_103770 [Parastagonospora nodorum]KAH4272894.1 hypothetical protein HBI04_140330 [Parastagonospora nodorum]KAH5076501.1 hypothetical protein HBH95_121710 [Parastagonospora nodorum]KAH5312019.1 hypothetical protein HBI50_152080 [Parastagonospora nodorum]KAH5413667.1 hypothetical protein HBI32_123890 [Parastagonospora nodorum]
MVMVDRPPAGAGACASASAMRADGTWAGSAARWPVALGSTSTASPRPAGAYAFAESSPVCYHGHVFSVVMRCRGSTGCLRAGTLPAETPGGGW